MGYNYKEAIKDDISFWMHDNDTSWSLYGEEKEDAVEELYEEIWTVSAITGNGGEWYDDAENCAHYLADNVKLVIDSCYDAGLTWEQFRRFNDETVCQYLDCVVRCQLLFECCEELWDEMHGEN